MPALFKLKWDKSGTGCGTHALSLMLAYYISFQDQVKFGDRLNVQCLVELWDLERLIKEVQELKLPTAEVANDWDNALLPKTSFPEGNVRS